MKICTHLFSVLLLLLLSMPSRAAEDAPGDVAATESVAEDVAESEVTEDSAAEEAEKKADLKKLKSLLEEGMLSGTSGNDVEANPKQSPSPGTQKEELPPLWTGGDIFTVIVMLLVLLTLLALTVWARKFMLRSAGQSQDISIVSRQAIDQRSSLVIARVRGRDFLIGVSQDNVNLLTMVPRRNPDEEESAEPQPAEETATEEKKEG